MNPSGGCWQALRRVGERCLRAGLFALPCLAMGAASPVPAQKAPPLAAERAALAEQRRLTLRSLADEEAACQTRFAVTACLDDVRRRRREALAPLRERELRLEEAERRERAEQRRRGVDAKRAAAVPATPGPVPGPAGGAVMSSPVPATGTPLPAPGMAPSAAAASRPATVTRVRRPSRSASEAAEREAQAAARVREAERRRDEAGAVRERIERRQSQRDATGRRSDPLPLPGATGQTGASGAASRPDR